MKTAAGLLCLTLVAATNATAQTPPTRRADSLLALMTLPEKLGQLAMVPHGAQTGPAAASGTEQSVRQGRIGSFLGLYGAEATRRMQRIAVAESRLHIPLLFGYDVIHGFRTIFPVPLAEAASFDSAAVSEAARVAAVEASAAGLHWTFAPMVDIARDPRWGRIVEGAGEDPRLGAVMAAARVRGFQGDRLRDSTSLLATAKHFAAYGAPEGGRDYNSTDVPERTLWEVYLPPFEAAVRAGAGSIMAAFNDIAGTPAHASRWLLQDVLRDRWGFRGLVVSDWAGVEELEAHGVAGGPAEAAARALGAGVDIEMASSTYSALPGVVAAGRLPAAAIDSAVRRVLLTKEALGLFDDPYRGTSAERERAATLTLANRAAARRIAREAIVLLKNDGVLPLRKDLASIAVIGPLADDSASALGPWDAAGRSADAVTVLAGVRAAVVRGNSRVTYARGVPVDSADLSGAPAAERLAAGARAVLLILGESRDLSGEASSRSSLGLPGAQLELARRVIRAARRSDPAKPVAVVLMNGRPLAVRWLADSAPAIVESWFLGVEHGHAVADILFGDASPSGRLPVSMPRAVGQVPVPYAHRNTGRPHNSADHYTTGYLDLPETPLWPFGHGLSFTTFRYGRVRPAADTVRAGDSLAVEVEVTNTGHRAGDEVVQLYLRDDVASVAQPVRRLVRFERVGLKPEESRTVRFVLRPEDLALYDLGMRRVVEPGGFTLYAGGSSVASDSARFSVAGDTLVLAPAPPRFR